MPITHKFKSQATMADTQKTQKHNDHEQNQQQALHLKTLAESTYNSTPTSLKTALKYATQAHNLYPSLPGLLQLLTSLQVLQNSTPKPEHYSILNLDPFSSLSSVKSHFKKLALLLHPDKNQNYSSSSLQNASSDAFKLVNDAFRVLSDRSLRKEYDTNLRLALAAEKAEEDEEKEEEEEEEESMFWTACLRCELMHKFERKYVGRRMVCPNCNQGFKALEFDEIDDDDDDEGSVRVRRSERARVPKRVFGVEEGLEKIDGEKGVLGVKSSKVVQGKLKNSDRKLGFGKERSKNGERKCRVVVEDSEEERELTLIETLTDEGKSKVAQRKLKNNDGKLGFGKERSKNGKRKRGRSEVVVEDSEEGRELTLVENPIDEGRSEVAQGKLKNNDRKPGFGGSTNVERERGRSLEVERELTLAEMKLEAMKKKMKGKKKEGKVKIMKIREENEEEEEEEEEEKKKGMRSQLVVDGGDMEVMVVEDSDFYDFDEDRVERSFKKGQVWAIYDDDDGMPRHYGLIDELVSVNPFEVKMSWLDVENHGDDELISWERMGFRVSCGRFKVARKDTINLLNIFSHLVECERAARELYRIYPRKGSVWALYNEQALVMTGGNSSGRDKRDYDIVVLLTSYSEMHGLSMAYLEKVDRFRAVFKRREIGFHAIRWLEKDDIRLFSHQIPARKLSGNEVPDISCDCWELDPASLPSNLLAITSGK